MQGLAGYLFVMATTFLQAYGVCVTSIQMLSSTLVGDMGKMERCVCFSSLSLFNEDMVTTQLIVTE